MITLMNDKKLSGIVGGADYAVIADPVDNGGGLDTGVTIRDPVDLPGRPVHRLVIIPAGPFEGQTPPPVRLATPH